MFPFDGSAVPADLQDVALMLADPSCLVKRNEELVASTGWADGSPERAHRLQMAWLYEMQAHRRSTALRILEGQHVEVDRTLTHGDADLERNALIVERAEILDALKSAERRARDEGSIQRLRAAASAFRPRTDS